MNQIIAAIMLFGVITVVFAPLIADTGSQMFSKSVSISDTMDASRKRTGEMIVMTGTQQHNGTTAVFFSNIGVEDVRIHAVLIEGTESSYSLLDQDLAPMEIFPAGELGALEIDRDGDTIQIVTTSGKLFEFFM